MKAPSIQLGAILTVLAVAMAFAPAAVAGRPDDRGGMLGVGAASSSGVVPDALERAVARAIGEQPIHPSDRSGMLGVGGVTSQRASLTYETRVRPDDRGGVRGPGPTPVAVVTEVSDFDWTAAGIGAIGAFGLALLLFVATQLVAHERRRQAAV